MVGSAIVRRLQALGFYNLALPRREELDLLDQKKVGKYFTENRPEYVFLAAAKVGGIHANNTFPAAFIYENLVIETNVVHAAHETAVKQLLFLGSSCIYPGVAEQPMREEALLTGTLEPTNEPYAIAKIAGIKLCESYNRQYGTDYRSVMPTNLYGRGDNFHPENAHVIPALMRRMHEARQRGAEEVVVWGSGQPKREFLYVDDLAEACVHVMELEPAVYRHSTRSMLSHINVGTGEDLSIRALAEMIGDIVGFEGKLVFDTSRPDGTMRKLLDVSRLDSLGWRASTSLEEGLRETYRWYLAAQVA